MPVSRRRIVGGLLLAMLVNALPLSASLARDAQAFGRAHVQVVTQAGQRHDFSVEVATTDEQLAQGLMYRRSMAADAGMLFDFGAPRPVSMWMKNTLIPLDMLFIGQDGRVVGVTERAVPGSLEMITAPGLIRGVLEVNGGTISRLGIHTGDRVVNPLFGN